MSEPTRRRYIAYPCQLILVALAVTTGAIRAQTNDFYEIHETYPFAASQAVASDAATDTIYMGAGSGFMALDGTSAQPAPLTGSSISDYRARCQGFVRDIVVTDTKVWVAAGVGGLQRWDRATNEQDFAFNLDESLPNAWCLSEIIHDSGDASDYVFVGSNDLELSGKVYLVKVESTGDVAVQDSIQLMTPIFAVAATNTLVSNTITVLVGKRCHPQIYIPVGPCDSLRRYDIPTSGTGAFNFQAPTIPTWGTDCNDPIMVRDIIIDQGTSPATAYVAASIHGVHAFSLASMGMTEITTGGWPITSSSNQVHYDSVSLFSDGSYRALIVATGNKFETERQHWGELNTPFACDGGDISVATNQGVTVFDLSESPVSAQDGRIGVGTGAGAIPYAPLVSSVRSQGSGNFRIDLACDPKSLTVVMATHNPSGNWDLANAGHWSDQNATTSQKVPGGSFDDIAILEAPSGASASAYAYVTAESKLLTFEAPATGASFDTFTGITANQKPAILLSRVSPDVAQPLTQIYSEVFKGGIGTECQFFDIATTPGVPIASTGTLDTHGRSFCTFLANGFDNDLLLYVVNQWDEDGGSGGSCTNRLLNGGVRVYRVTDANGDQVAEPSTTATPQLGQFVESICSDTNVIGTYFDAYVRTNGGSSSVHDIWVTYGPRDTEEGNGLLPLQATWNDPGIDFTAGTKVPFGAPVPSNASRLTFDSSRNILYAAYSTAGVAMYDVSGSTASELGHFYFGLLEGHAMSSLQIWPGPGTYVYVALMGYGVGIIDATNGTSFAQGFVLGSPFKLPGVCNAFADAPVVDDEIYPPRSALYVADGRGGVHWVQFKVFN